MQWNVKVKNFNLSITSNQWLIFLTVWIFSLTLHERHVRGELCKLLFGVTSCFSLPLLQSQTLRRPSGVIRAKNRPSFSNLQRQTLLSICHYSIFTSHVQHGVRNAHSDCAASACFTVWRTGNDQAPYSRWIDEITVHGEGGGSTTESAGSAVMTSLNVYDSYCIFLIIRLANSSVFSRLGTYFILWLINTVCFM